MNTFSNQFPTSDHKFEKHMMFIVWGKELFMCKKSLRRRRCCGSGWHHSRNPPPTVRAMVPNHGSGAAPSEPPATARPRAPTSRCTEGGGGQRHHPNPRQGKLVEACYPNATTRLPLAFGPNRF